MNTKDGWAYCRPFPFLISVNETPSDHALSHVAPTRNSADHKSHICSLYSKLYPYPNSNENMAIDNPIGYNSSCHIADRS